MLSGWIRWVGLGLVSAMLYGCGDAGPSLTPAKGKVLYKDQPLAGATVTFLPGEKGQVATAVTDAGGQFSLNTLGRPGAGQGQYKVGIIKAGQEGPAPSMTPEEGAKMAMQGKKPPEAKSEIPKKYGAPQTSGLEATVTADAAKNNFEFKLAD